MVEVYVSRIDGDGPLPTRDVPLCEQARIDRHRHPEERRRFVFAWALAGRVLAARLGVPTAALRVARDCRRCGADHGKPTLIGEKVHFSLSHAGNRVALAVSDAGPVGIDIETSEIDDWSTAMSQMVLDAGEAVTRSRDRATYWTRKEAVLKATGDGLLLPMCGIRVTPPGGRARVVAWRERPEMVDRLRLYDLVAPPGYAASLAVVDDPCPPRGHADPFAP